MSFTIGKWFTFDAAHSLPHLPTGHKCRRLHGHTYRVQLVLRGHLDENGFVTDYGDLRGFQSVIESLDHQNLNEVLAGLIPCTTAEHLAAWLFKQAEALYPNLGVVYVEVRETPNTFARFTP
jgi:6-pyruvoyltetrahydropterin/6-carboxytetrahydropterin synthase